MKKLLQSTLPSYCHQSLFIVLFAIVAINNFSSINQGANFSFLSYLLIFWILFLFFIYFRWISNPTHYDRYYLKVFYFILAYLGILILVLLTKAVLYFPEPIDDLISALLVSAPVVGIPLNARLSKPTHQSSKSHFYTKNTLIIGVGKLAAKVEKEYYSYHSSRYQIKGFINCKNEGCFVSTNKVIGILSDIHSILRENPVDEIIIALPLKCKHKIKKALVAADYYGVRVKYVPDFQGIFGEEYKVTRYGQLDAVNVRPLPLDNKLNFYIKESFDILFAAIALVLLCPLFIIIALMIKLDSSGPVFYCPIRVGKGGRPFKMYKFRSMLYNDISLGGTLSTKENDPRVSKLGKVLRKYSIDELPQFINVLLGDMSTVGPRPHRHHLTYKFQESEDKYMVRHYVKPGITGWAQVNGWRGPTETKEQTCQRTLHDLWYIKNWTFGLDLKIIFLTIFSSKARKNSF